MRAEVDPRGLHRTDIGGVEQRLLNLVCIPAVRHPHVGGDEKNRGAEAVLAEQRDRKSTRLNSSHSQISYAVFCLKKKKSSAANIPTLEDSNLYHRHPQP